MAVPRLEMIEGKVAVILPPEVLTELGLSPGDAVTVGPASVSDGAEWDRQLALVEQIMDERAAVLRALAR